MGRGRAKAKQAKVARQLKYHSPDMDLEQLQRELAGSKSQDESDDDGNDPYSKWVEYYDDSEDDSR